MIIFDMVVLHHSPILRAAEHVSRRPILDDLFCYDCVTRVWRRVDTTANGLRLQAELTSRGQHDAARVVAERAFQRPPPRRAHSLTAFTAMPLPPTACEGSGTAAQAAAPPHGKPNTALVVYGGVGVQPGRGDVTLGDLWLVDTTEPGRETFIRIHEQPTPQQVSKCHAVIHACGKWWTRSRYHMVPMRIRRTQSRYADTHTSTWCIGAHPVQPCHHPHLAPACMSFFAAARHHQGWRCPVRLRRQ